MKPTQSKSDIVWYDCLDSTNSEVRRRIRELDNLSVTAARYQTAGRGQGSHVWLSPKGENLTFSMLLRFGHSGISPLPASDALHITRMATLSIHAFLEEEGVSSRIKWPNDIWVDDRKICGMLIENILDGGFVSESIVGIGINLNQKSFDPSLPNPVSLFQLSGKEYPAEATLRRIYAQLCRHAALLDSDDGRCELEREFEKYLFHLEKAGQDRLDAAIADFEAGRRP